MKKLTILLLLFSIMPLHLFCNSDESSYLFSDTSRELYDTGNSTASTYLITIGEHLNSAISPNVFYSYGLGTDIIENLSLAKMGTLIFQARNIISLLISSVPNPAETPGDPESQNFLIRGNLNFQYPFKIPGGVKKLNFTISPYLQFDYLLGIHMNIANIPLQSFFSLNLGGKLGGQYEIFNTVRVGVNFSSFLIGMDTGRNGYNKNPMLDLVFAHFGNYLDLNLAVFGELDLSRTESLRLSYFHAAKSYFGGENSIINGEHQVGLTYNRKLIR